MSLIFCFYRISSWLHTTSTTQYSNVTLNVFQDHINHLARVILKQVWYHGNHFSRLFSFFSALSAKRS